MLSDASAPRPSSSLALGSLPAAILVLDEAEALVDWSRAAAELLNLANPHRGKPWSLLIPRSGRLHAEQALKLTRQKGQWIGEVTLQTTNGDELRAELRIVDRSLSGERGLMVGVTNLSARVNQEQAFRQAWQRRVALRLAEATAAEMRVSLSSRAAASRIEQFESLAQAIEADADDAELKAILGSVLVVGCGPLERECLRMLLEAWGYTVHVAEAGFEAIERVKMDRVGVQAVLVDADLPGWGASAAITALKQWEPFLPIILLGSPDEKRIADELSLVVPKPYRFEEVRWAIAECRTAGV